MDHAAGGIASRQARSLGLGSVRPLGHSAAPSFASWNREERHGGGLHSGRIGTPPGFAAWPSNRGSGETGEWRQSNDKTGHSHTIERASARQDEGEAELA